MTSGADPVLLFHGTTKSAAEAIVAGGFRPPDVAWLQRLAEKYGVEYEALAAESSVDYVWHRSKINDYVVHLSTHREMAAEYARRGSEIDHYGLWAIYFLRHPSSPKKGKGWWRSAQEFAKAEAARIDELALVRLEVPRLELSASNLEKVDHAKRCAELLQDAFIGEVVLLEPDEASRWIAGVEEVTPERAS